MFKRGKPAKLLCTTSEHVWETSEGSYIVYDCL